MRILFFSTHYPSVAFPNRATYSVQSLETLAEHAEVKALVPISWTERMMHGPDTMQNVTASPTRYFLYFFLPKLARRTYATFMWLSSLRMRRVVRSFSPTILLSSWAYPDGVAAVKLARNLRIPCIVTALGSDIYLHCRFPSRRRQVVSTLTQAEGVITVSKALKNELVSMGVPKEKVHVCYNGVHASKFFPRVQSEVRSGTSISQKASVFLFIGNLLKSKGTLDLLDAFWRLCRERGARNHTLLFIGHGRDRSILEKRIEALTAVDKLFDVRVLGQIKHDELGTWINASDFLCLPSYSEGVPNVILESMSCGKPVIASEVGGIPEVVTEETGVLTPVGDIEGLAKALGTAADMTWNPENIVAHSRKFSWDSYAKETLKVVRNCIDGSRKREK